MDNVLHKYRGDSKFTESIITSGKVYLATAHLLNDPFECTLQDISKEWMDQRITESMQAALTGFALTAKKAINSSEYFFGLKSSATQVALDSVLSAGGLSQSYDAWRAFILEHTGHAPSDIRAMFQKIDAQLVETGIFSMSSDPAQPLMWAHYADQHRGLCLGFRKVSSSKLADPTHCLPVIYSDQLPKMEDQGLNVTLAMSMDQSSRLYTSSLKLAFTDKTFQRVVTTKPTCWSYEQEVRYIEPFSGLCNWPGELAECTFGLRCREDRRRHYIDLLETHVSNDVQLFEMRTKHGMNAMERVPSDPPVARSRRPAGRSRRPAGREEKNAAEPEQLSLQQFAARMEQLLQQERYGEVIYQTGENLKASPSSPVLLHLKAVAHGSAGEHATAFDIFRQLKDQHPGVAAGWYGMACVLEQMGRLDDVVPLLQQASRLDPNDPSIALNLGVHLIGNPETRSEGLAHLRRAEKLGHRRARQIIDRVEIK
jgi:tetratricopeptide (TPR) repeat protein